MDRLNSVAVIVSQHATKTFAALDLAVDSTDVVIGERESFLPLCFHHCVELSLVELDDLQQLAMHPADENHEEELPGLKNEVHSEP
ncbi:MAG: hypothetical protein QGF59_03870 [Pirellulaceae bacterium]|nr:hypothetical protein [Pirellulaceae bacterium]